MAVTTTSNIGVKSYLVEGAIEALPQTTQDSFFTVSGLVLITSIVAGVTTDIQAQPNSIKLVSNPTIGADVDLCAALEINGDAAGTMYSITGTLTDPLVATTSGAFAAQADGVVVAPGTIDVDATASSTGNFQWRINYIPLQAGATIVAA